MERLDYGEEVSCSSFPDNVASGPGCITANAPIFVLCLATGNDCSGDKDIVTNGFSCKFFISYTWITTISITVNTAVFMPLIDADLADICPPETCDVGHCLFTDGSPSTGRLVVCSSGDIDV